MIPFNFKPKLVLLDSDNSPVTNHASSTGIAICGSGVPHEGIREFTSAKGNNYATGHYCSFSLTGNVFQYYSEENPSYQFNAQGYYVGWIAIG